MRYSTAGRPRRVTDEQVRRLLEWKPLKELRKEFGLSEGFVRSLRRGEYQFKQKSP